MVSKRYRRDSIGIPVLELGLEDGRTAIVTPDLKRTILDEAGAVFLGSAFEDDLPVVVLPADPSQARGETSLYGFSQDPDVAAAAREFLGLVDADGAFDRALAAQG